MSQLKTPKLLRQEEIWNIGSHGIGVILALIGFVFLFQLAYKAQTPFALLSACIFSLSLIGVYTSSTAYHISKLANSKLVQLYKTIDHINIYYLIAGTYTPFLLLAMGNSNGWSFFKIIWTIALIGTIFKILYKSKYPLFSLLFYLAMGWLIIFDIQNFIASTPKTSFYLILAGGISYTIGTFFYAKEKLKFNHFYWHLFVLAGSALHYAAVYRLYEGL